MLLHSGQQVCSVAHVFCLSTIWPLLCLQKSDCLNVAAHKVVMDPMRTLQYNLQGQSQAGNQADLLSWLLQGQPLSVASCPALSSCFCHPLCLGQTCSISHVRLCHNVAVPCTWESMYIWATHVQNIQLNVPASQSWVCVLNTCTCLLLCDLWPLSMQYMK